MFTQASAAIVAASRNAALPLSVIRNERNGVRADFQAVFSGVLTARDDRSKPTRIGCCYLILSYSEKIGRYIEITMKPTTPPMNMIITGSSSDVRALILASTSAS